MREYANINNVNVGDHVTVCLYTDAISYTVVKKTNRTISVQKDHQEIDHEKWKPNIIPGGFAGYCVNNYEQTWKVKSNTNAPIDKFFAGKDGFFKSKGSRRKDIILGAHPFYDYNF